MHNNYDSEHDRLLRLNDFIIANKIKLDIYPLVSEVASLIHPLIRRLEVNHEAKSEKTKLVTSEKKGYKNNTAIFLFGINQLFFNYYVKINKLKPLIKFKHPLGQLKNMKDVDLLTEANQRITDCEAMGETLAEVGITAENLADLKTHTELYKTAMPQPTERRNLNKRLKHEEEALIKQADDIVNLRLNKVMIKYFSIDDPDLYAAYKDAIRKENFGTRKLALKGMILNKETGEPLKGVHITIPKLNIDHLCQGKKGGYMIKNIETGIFDMKVEVKNFESQEVVLVHNEGEMVVMNFMMEPLSN